MRDFRDAKIMARTLRDALRERTVDISHADSLELISKAFGCNNWNILSALITTASLINKSHREAIREPHCANCGKSRHDVRKLVGGPTAFICDRCIASSMRLIKDGIEIASIKRANDNE